MVNPLPEIATECALRALDGSCRPGRACLPMMQVHYQPLVRLATGRIIGAEALVRCGVDPARPLLPGAFIPASEETGFIRVLGEWVLERALLESRAWSATAPLLSVNVSPVQMSDVNLPSTVARLLKASGRKPHRLLLELTESCITPANAPVLSELREMDVKLALDDFGTGYSSLDVLRRVSFDYLKLPREFVSGIAGQTVDATIGRAIIQLAESLGIELIAEGIEERDQAVRLEQLGCNLGQGFLYSKAVPAAEFSMLPDTIGTAGWAKVGAGRHALVVDDEDPARRALARILRSAEFEVAEAADGISALDAVAARRPDLAVVDVELPGLNGRELVRRLRTDGGRRFPVIHVSGKATQPQDRAEGLLAGSIAYLTKPILAAELIATAEAVLRAV